MVDRTDAVWQSDALVQKYLTGVRSAIPLAAEQIEVMLRLIEGSCDEVRSFLDLGCGDGVLGAAILDRYPDARGAFVDFAPAMITAAQEQLRDRSAHLTFLTLDYVDASWLHGVSGHAPFDAIVSGFSIHHQADARKRESYGELYDLLAPGGVFVNVEHVASATPWVADVFDKLFIDSLVRLHEQQGTGRSREQVASDFYNRPDKAANILAPVETQCEWLREIGFVDVDCYFKIFELAVFGGRRVR
jgi:SAM-dependent methyltransferase